VDAMADAEESLARARKDKFEWLASKCGDRARDARKGPGWFGERGGGGVRERVRLTVVCLFVRVWRRVSIWRRRVRASADGCEGGRRRRGHGEIKFF